MKFEIYERKRFFRKRGQWYWRLKADNNEIIAQSEGYNNWSDGMAAIELVKKSDGARIDQEGSFYK